MSQNVPRELKSDPFFYIFLAGLGYLLIAEVWSFFSGFAQVPHRVLLQNITTSYCACTACLGGVLWCAYQRVFDVNRWVLLSLLGIGAEYYLYLQRDSSHTVLSHMLLTGAGLCGVCMVALLLQALWHRCHDRSDLMLQNLDIFFATFTMVVCNSIAFPCDVNNTLVYDAMLCHLDGLLGFLPSFALTAWCLNYPAINIVLIWIYAALPLLMIVAQAVAYRDELSGYRYLAFNPTIVYAVLAICGLCAYDYFPAVGTMVFCGDSFPLGIPSAWEAMPQAVPMPLSEVRNAMPSLHLSSIIIAFMAVWRNRVKFWKYLYGILVFLTLISAITVGNHWITDFVVALPFVTAIIAAVSYRLSWQLRCSTVAVGTVLSVGMMYMMKNQCLFFLIHPGIYFGTAIIIDIWALWGLWILSKVPIPSSLEA